MINKTVKYLKEGSRQGWYGTIIDLTAERVLIRYENGVEQDYRADALLLDDEPYDKYTYGGYLRVILQESITSPTPGSYLVYSNNGLVGFEQNLEDAELFAYEQTVDTGEQHIVYKPVSTFKIKQPQVVKATNK